MPAANSGPYTLAAKSNWYYWFYPDNGNWLDYQSQMNDPRVLYIVPRPQLTVPEWNVLTVHTRVVLESKSNTYRYSYRVLVENPTDSTVGFYIAVYTLR